MTNHIGRTFPHHGLKGIVHTATVIDQSAPKGKRQTVIVTIHLDNGTEFKMNAERIPPEIVFAPPATGPMFSRDDQYYYDRNGRIFCK